jgi:predicted RNA-binding Zn ribbon-like protein
VGEMSDDAFLLAVLNSTPVVDGAIRDELADPAHGGELLVAAGGRGTPQELRALTEARDALQAVVRGAAPASSLAPALAGVTSTPAPAGDRVEWTLQVPPGRGPAVRAVLAWSALAERSPGRLRPCANDECRLFLVDRSKANTARWCSMAVCGNRMKARRHHRRSRPEE